MLGVYEEPSVGETMFLDTKIKINYNSCKKILVLLQEKKKRDTLFIECPQYAGISYHIMTQ